MNAWERNRSPNSRQNAPMTPASKKIPMRFNMAIVLLSPRKSQATRQSPNVARLDLFSTCGVAKVKSSDATSLPVFQSQTSTVYCGDPLILVLVMT